MNIDISDNFIFITICTCPNDILDSFLLVLSFFFELPLDIRVEDDSNLEGCTARFGGLGL
jgi:hypothetical protein